MPWVGRPAIVTVPEPEGGVMEAAYAPTLGLSEQELREMLTQELILAMRSEGDAPTIHAIALGHG